MSQVALALASFWLTRGVLHVLHRSPKGWSTALLAVATTTIPWAIRWRAFLLGPPETEALTVMAPLWDLVALSVCVAVLSAIALSPLVQEGPARHATVLDGVLGGIGLVLAGLTRRWELGLVFGAYGVAYGSGLYALAKRARSEPATYRSAEPRRERLWPLFAGAPWVDRDPAGACTKAAWL